MQCRSKKKEKEKNTCPVLEAIFSVLTEKMKTKVSFSMSFKEATFTENTNFVLSEFKYILKSKGKSLKHIKYLLKFKLINAMYCIYSMFYL